MIGGNITLDLQIKSTSKNSIGESVELWANLQTLTGWLDYQSGDSPLTNYNSKIKETTHFFICDYVPIDPLIKEENCRAVCKGEVYEVLVIDDPMEKHRQLEIYLKYTGAQVNVGADDLLDAEY